MVIFDEFAVNEACAFVEQVIVWLNIKQVSNLTGIIFLNLVFYYESHVAEGKF